MAKYGMKVISILLICTLAFFFGFLFRHLTDKYSLLVEFKIVKTLDFNDCEEVIANVAKLKHW